MPLWSRGQLGGNFEVGETVTTDKLQVHTDTHKVDLKRNSHAKTFFGAITLQVVAANICSSSKVFLTTFPGLARP